MQRAVTIIAKGFGGLLVVALLACAATLGYARTQGLLLLSVQTGSMRPAIQPGDAVLLRQGPGKLVVGDIISYRSPVNPKATVTHRVVSINQATGRIITKGDALEVADPAVRPAQVIGRVEHTIPGIGYSFDSMRHPIGLVLVVYVPAAVLAGGEIRRLMRYYEAQHYRLHAYMW